MKHVMALIALAILSGCACRTYGDFCDVAHPIRPSMADVNTMSDELVDQILTYDRTGQTICGWKQ